ncbi:hypothetical protein CONPUDRAFT_150549 [Coniophora puteana RWD-64-598 SS2]|uniref:Uncharacterized protein n=1 Tax=Coniophora puteana (strain RWD-64-598) TaxID=741705 RepID=A0A5M3N326_CONPW|nr:uncharacterized protein CONPUDRAFT_150549 [Coniophora puteana RWD-64-598 SS2]EIW85768.1 hypothetical protein CONPUDRAFT_150549 [Coniophora puteana RWD-64-598 SS2]
MPDSDDEEFPSVIGGLALDDDERFTRSLQAIAQLPDTASNVQVRKALHDTQEEHKCLFDAFCALKDQVRVLYTLLPKDKKRSFDRGLSLGTMMYESKFKSKGASFATRVRPWVSDGTFPLSPLARNIDPNDPSRFENANAGVQGAMADVYHHMGDNNHDVIEQEETFASSFTKGVDGARRIYTTALRGAQVQIFGSELTAERKLRLLKKDIKSSKYDRQAPVLYANPDKPVPQEFLMSEALIKAIIVKFFGPTGLKTRRLPRSRSKAKGSQLTKVEPQMIASTSVDVRYLLTNDPMYLNPGSPSGIPYGADRDKVLQSLLTGNAVWSFKVLELFNYEIFGIPPTSSTNPLMKQPSEAPGAQEEDEEDTLNADLDAYYASLNSESSAAPELSPMSAAEPSDEGSQSLSALTKQVNHLALEPASPGVANPDEPGANDAGDGVNANNEAIATAYLQERSSAVENGGGGLRREAAYLDIQSKDAIDHPAISTGAMNVTNEDSVSAGRRRQGGGSPQVISSGSISAAGRATQGRATTRASRNPANADRLEGTDILADATAAKGRGRGPTTRVKKTT